MRELVGKLKEEFDYILIDCPAGIEQGFKNAIAGADRAIVVTTAEISAIRDADRIIGLLESSEIKNPELVINRIRPNMDKKGEMMDVDDIVDLLSIDLIGVVPDDEYIITQTNKGEPVIQNKRAPSGKAYICLLYTSGKMLDRLSEKYKINIKIVDKILNISKDQRYNLNRGQKYINLKSKVDERKWILDMNMEKVIIPVHN